MDLRSIINSDTSSATQTSRAQPIQPSPVKQNSIEPHQGYHNSYVPSASHPGGYQHRPAPPPPLQPPGPNDFRSPGGSSSYHSSAQSPYQKTPSSSLSGGQYPFPQHPPQSPAQGSHAQAYPSITPTGQHPQQAYAYPSHSPYTPSATTPGGSHHYPQQHPSHSSHSSPTPSSAHSQGTYTHRESPLSAGPPSFSQPQRLQHSQPGTPLGPPIERQRASAGVLREERILSNNHHIETPIAPGYLQTNARPPSQILPKGPEPSEISPTKYNHIQPMLSDRERNVRGYLTERDRERSLSVSPKTKIPSQPKQETAENRHNRQETWSGQVTPAKRKAEGHPPFGDYQHSSDQGANSKVIVAPQDDPSLRPIIPNTPSGQHSVNGGTVTHKGDTYRPANTDGKELHNIAWSGEQTSTTTLSPASYSNSTQQPFMKSPSRPASKGLLMPSPMSPADRPSATPQPLSDRPSPISGVVTNKRTPRPATSTLENHSAPLSSGDEARPKRSLEVALGATSSNLQPPKKKRKNKEIPIWAQCVIPGRWNSYNPDIPPPAKEQPAKKESVKQVSQDAQGIKPTVMNQESRTQTPSRTNNGVFPPVVPPDSGGTGPLGPWEPSITNTIPYEELTRGIADFLMHQVVQRDDVAAGGAEAVSGQEAVLEIEAKIGQLINTSTDERLALPIRSECIIDAGHPSLRTNFRSSMTEVCQASFDGDFQ